MMTTPGSFLSGRAMLYMDRYKWAPIVMLSIAAMAVALLVIHPLMPVWAVALITGLVGMGPAARIRPSPSRSRTRSRISRSASPWAR